MYLHRTKSREFMGLLKIDEEEMVSLGEDMRKALNGYFSSVFTKEDKHTVPVCEEIFRGEESKKLKDVEVTRK